MGDDDHPMFRKREPPVWQPQPPPRPQPYEDMPYGHPPYEQQPPVWQEQAPRPQFQPSPPTNGLAIASLILSISAFVALPLIGSVGGVICGHMARSQLRRAGYSDRGDGLALAGLIIGWVGVAFYVGLAVLVVAIGLSL
jgi:hypothetical protein